MIKKLISEQLMTIPEWKVHGYIETNREINKPIIIEYFLPKYWLPDTNAAMIIAGIAKLCAKIISWNKSLFFLFSFLKSKEEKRSC